MTIGTDGGYHCIFVAGVPMYHGMDLELVMAHALRVKEAIIEQLGAIIESRPPQGEK